MSKFKNKVVVVTGAGNGIGRQYALAFARAGAKVVVNDLGGARDGEGTSSRAADSVVDEIKALGAEAVANYASVSSSEGADEIVGAALTAFGRIDVLVNNAGILRDKTMVKMDEAMFDSVVAVHLRGTWLCTRAAARAFIEQGTGGRIVNTSSVAGLKGNFGQTNYAAAKAGIYGLSLSAAQELQRHSVTVNCVAPIAKTRMTEELAVVPDELLPEHIAPVVLWLASEDAAMITGRVFGVHGEHVFEYKMTTTEGARDEWTPASLQARLAEIEGAKSAPPVAKPVAAVGSADPIAEVFARMPAGFLEDKARGWKAVMHFEIDDSVFTVKIDDGVCTTSPSREGNATCVVKTDRATFLGMIDGSVDGQQAFMAGKISATNLADMMKYKGAFSKEKAAAGNAAPATTKKTAAEVHLSDDDKLAWLRAGGASKLDVPGLTVDLGDEKIVFDGGHKAVRTDRETLLALLSGQLNLKDALAQMRVVTDGVRELGALKRALDDADWLKAIARSLADRPVRLAQGYSEKVFHGAPVVVTREHASAYARATGLPLSDEEFAAAPPMLAVRYHHELARQALTDGGIELDLLRLVFGEQDMRWHAPLQIGDVLSPKAQLHSVEHKDSGSVLKYRFSLWRSGELVNETISTYFVRGKSRATSETKAVQTTPAFEHTIRFDVRADITSDYAEASLDDNPIHLNENIARAAGFEGVINHGLCTLALASNVIVDTFANSDVTRLRGLSARFQKPVYPGQELTLCVRALDAKHLELQVVNADGVAVLTQGAAELA